MSVVRLATKWVIPLAIRIEIAKYITYLQAVAYLVELGVPYQAKQIRLAKPKWLDHESSSDKNFQTHLNLKSFSNIFDFQW